ncbi:MAG: JAB domain-containing protein [Clostridiales bacterium]|nr:JAB domain-containing protein [Clostridiales bacterium]MCF8023060.1 JAB domain-containing protein [Clostridiales bacterium]
MAFLVSSNIREDIFYIKEVEEISTKSEEQVILVFMDDNNVLHTLYGESGGTRWAVIPPLNIVLDWLISRGITIKEAVIIHNHPEEPWFSGIIPSQDDIVLTEVLKWQLALLGIKLVDHIIVSPNDRCSLCKMELYDYGPFVANGFEIKRFIYCFLIQFKFIFENELALNDIILLLEDNLDKLKNYYDRPVLKRAFMDKPQDESFKNNLFMIKTADPLIEMLINFLLKLRDGKRLKVKVDRIMPLGGMLQKRLLCGV